MAKRAGAAMLIVQASDLHLFTSDEADPRAKKYLDISRPVAAWAKTAGWCGPARATKPSDILF